MKKFFCFLFLVILLSSCDDGDIVITSFEFDDVDLQLCEGAKENEFVFFKINTTINEAISYNFISDTAFSLSTITEPISINLEDNTSNLTYRQFNTPISADYYCSNIPASNINVTEELIGTSGTIEITTQIVEEDDNDNIPAEDEDLNRNGNLEDDDTDGDGIPNYKDQDDDDDNILTSAELGIVNNSDPMDSDKDGIPDYLDEDDDNDGIITRNEDANMNGNPRDDRVIIDGVSSLLFYLDPTSTNQEVIVAPEPKNTIQTTYRTTVNVIGVKFNNSGQGLENDNFSFGFSDVTIPITTNKM